MKFRLRKGAKMRLSQYRSGATGSRSGATPAIWLFVLALFGVLAFASGAEAAATPVPLATTASFGVLAGAGITNTGPTTVNGDIGTFPTTTVTGTATLTVNGTNHGGDAVTQQAKTDLVTAYNNAAGQGPTSPIAADLGGQTLTPGVYNSASSIGLTGALTLNGGGDPNAVFVFQAGSTLTTASASQVNLINGAQSCNVFWQVGSSATLGTGASLRGTILALTSITVTTGVKVDGRVLARNGAVTLDTDTITKPTCAAPTPTTTTSPPTPTSTPTPTAVTLPKAVNSGTGGQAAGHSSVPTSVVAGLALAGLLVVLSGGRAVVLRRRR
jgi:Ice-binding-like